MITHEIIQQMERELKSNLEQLMLAKHETRNERIVALFHSYTRKIVESVAEEIIGKVTEIPKTDRNGMSWDSTSFAEAGYEEENAKNELRAEQRLKVKEIISKLEK